MAAPTLSLVTWRKSPRLRSPPVVQPRPLVQIAPNLTGCSVTVATPYDGVVPCALRLCPSCTDHSALLRPPAPNTPPSLVSSVWYQAMSTRPSDPAVTHGNVLVPATTPVPETLVGVDQVSVELVGLAMVAGSSECTT